MKQTLLLLIVLAWPIESAMAIVTSDRDGWGGSVLPDSSDEVLRDVCLEIEKRYQIKFLEIGTDDWYG